MAGDRASDRVVLLDTKSVAAADKPVMLAAIERVLSDHLYTFTYFETLPRIKAFHGWVDELLKEFEVSVRRWAGRDCPCGGVRVDVHPCRRSVVGFVSR